MDVIKRARWLSRGIGPMVLAWAAVLGSTGTALAEEAKLDTGDTAWMLTSTALVLMMTMTSFMSRYPMASHEFIIIL